MSNYLKSNLKFLREQKGLSQTKLAKKIGVNQTTIGRWENGEITPTVDNVVDLLKALNSYRISWRILRKRFKIK